MTLQLRPLARAEVRQLDKQAADHLALPTVILMENAGRGAARWLADLLLKTAPANDWESPSCGSASALKSDTADGRNTPRVVILCGPGNNGGDGGVVARHLDAWGFAVHVIWFARADALQGDAALQWIILQKSNIPQVTWLDEHSDQESANQPAALAQILSDADWIVDGLFGTGLSRPVEGLMRAVIETMNGSGRPIFALDVPSGLDADTGQPLGVAVRASATATFVAAKLGFAAPGAVDYTGRVTIIDIGVPHCLLEPFLID